MELDPVYVLAPRRRITTRRAFLLAGAAGCLSFAGGYLLGARAASTASGGSESHPRIEWARSVVADGDDATLLDNLPAFLGVVHEAHQLGLDDQSLWDGVRRAAEALVADESISQRRLKARALLTIFDLQPNEVAWRELRDRLDFLARR